MTQNIFVILCDNCKNKQQICSSKVFPNGYKKCVFCGKNINLKNQVIRRKNG